MKTLLLMFALISTGRYLDWRSRRRAIHKALGLLLIALAIAACEAPPAWRPGDDPLVYWAPDDRAGELFAQGCAAWGPSVGLACTVTDDWRDATVEIIVEPGDMIDGAAAARTWTRVEADGNAYFTAFAETRLDDANGPAIAAHEVGHLLGLWEHLDDPGALMDGHAMPAARGPEPSAADVAAVRAVW